MKRTLGYVLVAFATFLIGTASHSVFYTQAEPPPHFHEDWVPTVAPQVVNDFPPQETRKKSEYVFDYDPAEFNPRGTYRILGRKPKGFRNFDCLELGVDKHAHNGKPYGSVVLGTLSGAGYDAPHTISAVVTKQWIYLVATPIPEDDFGYRFEGQFLRQGELWRAGPSKAVLKGRLTKTKGGEKVAEAMVEFRIEYLGC
jgi:hypothetical protein